MFRVDLPPDSTQRWSSTTVSLPTCVWCSCIHNAKCPLVKAIEYHPNGTVKRVEFYDPPKAP